MSIDTLPKSGTDPHGLFIFFSMSRGEIGDLSRNIIGQFNVGPGPETQLAYTCLIFNLACASLISEQQASECRVVVSRAASDYVKDPKVYNYKHINLAALVLAIDTLERDGFLEQKKGFKTPGYEKGLRTGLWPTVKFNRLLAQYVNTLSTEQIKEKGRLLLRNPDTGKLMKYYLSGKIKETHQLLGLINDSNLSYKYRYTPPPLSLPLLHRRLSTLDQSLLISNPNRKSIDLEPASISFNRVFMGRFHKGGRFYADFQNLRKLERATIEIDGEPTVELDYSSLHPTMIYHIKGAPVVGDPYQAAGIGPLNREAAKVALMCVFNATSRQVAIKAIVSGLKEKGIILHDGLSVSDCNDPAKSLIDLLIGAHAPIADKFFTGIGLDLQYLDSQLANNIMLSFKRAGRPCLGVHDSFIVKAEDKDTLRHYMESCYKVLMRKYKDYNDWVPKIQ